MSKILGAAAVVLMVAGVVSPSQAQGMDPYMRIEQLEQQLRQLTGQNEELQHRNRLLEQQLRQLPGPGAAPVGGQVGGQGGGPLPAASLPAQNAYPANSDPRHFDPRDGQAQPLAPPADAARPATPGRGDAFDPSRNPEAPGVPRPLGSAPSHAQVGAPGGRGAGEPLNLGAQGAAMPGPTGVGAAQGAPQGAGLTTLPPSQTPRDQFDLGIGYIQRKDYALAEETMRSFTEKYPSDGLVPEAQYWLGESMFQRQQYRTAAEVFLGVTTNYDKSAKAPDSLLRLGQSLAALKEKEAACAALGEVIRNYPKASSGVRNGAIREQKRVGC